MAPPPRAATLPKGRSGGGRVGASHMPSATVSGSPSASLMPSAVTAELVAPCNRRHGEPFPLPGVDPAQLPVHVTAQQVQRSINAINHLASSYDNSSYSLSSQQQLLTPTAVQSLSVQNIVDAISDAGPCPADMTEASAVRDILAAKSLYGGEPGNLARYDVDKLKVTKSKLRPQPLHIFCPNMLKHF
jgi:hypothetical protein